MFSLVTISGMAQTESGEEISPDEKLKWSVGGFFMLMAPYADDSYYEKDEERYVPQTTTVWLGSTRLSDGILKGSQSPFHLRNGFLKQQEGGVTFLQFSRNLYRWESRLQSVGSLCRQDLGCMPVGANGKTNLKATLFFTPGM